MRVSLPREFNQPARKKQNYGLSLVATPIDPPGDEAARSMLSLELVRFSS
jgi:hypothetical protein